MSASGRTPQSPPGASLGANSGVSSLQMSRLAATLTTAPDSAFTTPGRSRTVQAMRQVLADAPTGPDRISRDDEGLCLAFAAALRADCTRRRVGAVILNEEGRVVGVGRNGLAPGLPGCATTGACPRGRLSYEQVPAGVDGGSYSTGAGVCEGLHAEQNACIDAGRSRAKGGSIYITDEPCPLCRGNIRAAGIIRAVWPEGLWTP